MAQNEGDSLTVFVSYRRNDSPGHAGRIRDVLRNRFGERCVFYDVATIEGGVDFGLAVREAIEKAGVIVVIVGPQWSRRRMWDRLVAQPDWVQFEIEYARQLAKPILPVVVNGADMPAGRSLRPSIQFLSTIHAVAVRDESWDSDVKRLIDRLPVVAATPAAPQPKMAHEPSTRAKSYGALVLAGILAGLGVWLGWATWSNRTIAPQETPLPYRGVASSASATNHPPTTGKIRVQPYDAGLMSATKFLFTAENITDPDGDALKYTWDFGDGSPTPKSASSVTKIFDRVNRFNVKVLVTDDKIAEDVLAAEMQITVRDLTGTWTLELTKPKSPAMPMATRYVITLVQQGNTLSGRIVPEGSNRPTPLTGYVNDPNRVHFGSEHAWWNDDEDAYFDMEAEIFGLATRMEGRCSSMLYCEGVVAKKE